jgi:hypothetical protein
MTVPSSIIIGDLKIIIDALKLEVQLPKDNSAGIYEWNVK